MNLNKFTHLLLLKNDAQLKQKKWQITTQKRAITQIYHINKNHVPKKITSSKNKNKLSRPSPKKSKGKKKSDNWQRDSPLPKKRQKEGQHCCLGKRERKKRNAT